ncbi:MAG: AFG1 family ATPase [Gammaproteobacteria bacterium]|nr:AFG1 family ATPase [Gammaproteobacteria bacterium]MDE2140439.1 AFG1 family ATPase [Gammaproteobacteria bacterium]
MNDAQIPHTPRQRFAADLARPGFMKDAAQAKAVAALDILYHHLLAPHVPWWQRWYRRTTATPRGLYLWGTVGRGKTYLMDSFYECLPFAEKQRLHFHHFMQMVHARLKALPDQEDPLQAVAKQFSKQARVLCFDEFFVSDIGDAMLLGRLLQYLFEDGVTLVATSNLAPDNLYRDGLQRERFLPAIRSLKQHTHALHLDGGNDYRLRHLEKTRLYYVPAGAEADSHLQAFFRHLSGGVHTSTRPLPINDREIPVKEHADGVVWFGFRDICGGPRGAADYIEIARAWHTVLVSDIPLLDAERDDETRRFVALVDELYDRRVKLAVSAAAPLENLYTGKRLALEFQRTASRLTEMQSREYLCAPHLP